MYLGAGSDVAYFSFHNNGWIDRLQGIDCLSRSPHIFLEGQSGTIEHNRVKPGSGRFDCPLQGMGMVCVQKDWVVELIAQTVDQCCDLTNPKEFALALGRTYQHRSLQLLRSGKYRLQLNEV